MKKEAEVLKDKVKVNDIIKFTFKDIYHTNIRFGSIGILQHPRIYSTL
jgi:hypothetical protein